MKEQYDATQACLSPCDGLSQKEVRLCEGPIVGMNPAVLHHDKTILSDDAGGFRFERWRESSEEQN